MARRSENDRSAEAAVANANKEKKVVTLPRMERGLWVHSLRDYPDRTGLIVVLMSLEDRLKEFEAARDPDILPQIETLVTEAGEHLPKILQFNHHLAMRISEYFSQLRNYFDNFKVPRKRRKD